MVLWCGTVGKPGLDLPEALLMGLLLQGAWDAAAIPCASVGKPSAGMNGWGYRWVRWWALSEWQEEQNAFSRTEFRLPLFGHNMPGLVQVHSWVSCVLLQEPHPYIARAHPAPCPNGQSSREGWSSAWGLSPPHSRARKQHSSQAQCSAQHYLTIKT